MRIILFALLFLTGCATGPPKVDWITLPPDGPDTPNHYDPVHGWKF
jgi:hypothetical protein